MQYRSVGGKAHMSQVTCSGFSPALGSTLNGAHGCLACCPERRHLHELAADIPQKLDRNGMATIFLVGMTPRQELGFEPNIDEA